MWNVNIVYKKAQWCNYANNGIIDEDEINMINDEILVKYIW